MRYARKRASEMLTVLSPSLDLTKYPMRRGSYMANISCMLSEEGAVLDYLRMLTGLGIRVMAQVFSQVVDQNFDLDTLRWYEVKYPIIFLFFLVAVFSLPRRLSRTV